MVYSVLLNSRCSKKAQESQGIFIVPKYSWYNVILSVQMLMLKLFPLINKLYTNAQI